MNILSRAFAMLLLVSACFVQQGCFLAPAIDSFNKLGVTESDRKALLGERIHRFRDALYWGEPGEAIAFVLPQSRQMLEPAFRRIRKEEKIVDSRLESVEFLENGYKADVEMIVKYYRVPYYVVNERTEKQVWEFNMSDGWLLSERKEARSS